ncbi:hypothetical protein [uncultured Ruminococcus sp.]|uniref:hypothetical protein n=1 Tax=uncultured Ruminococcus sp. TaxID=165186 RepID=UPI0026339BEC|nr:hypothetical protein [uncultured Ruminococcus sp.]
MKKHTKQIAGLVCSLGLLLAAGVGSMTASATTVGDVIAHAYAVGLPESQIQACINQYGGGTYTSEQCDQAIAALDQWAAERNNAVDDVINEGTTTAAGDSAAQTTTTAAGNAAGAQTTTKAPTEQEFINMSLDEKVNYVNSLPADKRTEFMDNMSNDVRNSFLKQMDTSKQLEVVSSMLDVGDAFGLSYSVDSISDGALAISARDADGNLVSVSTFGDTVEATGIPYTVPVLVGGGAILLAAAGLGVVLVRSTKK